jgi:penicillin G amidase
VLSRARDDGSKITLEDMAKLQTDVVSLPARQLLKLLRAASPKKTNRAAQILLRWNGALSRDSAASALYEVWLRIVRKAVAQKSKIGDDVGEWSLEKVLEELSAAPTDVFGTNPIRGRNQLLLETLDIAWKEKQQLQGANPQNWSWGELHKVHFRHSLDQVRGSAELLDVGPVARPGDGYTVNATSFHEGSFQQERGASYREILDTSDWDRSLAINTPGQSGQPGSSHYSDLLPLWDKGWYFPLLYSSKAVERETKDRLLLNPH